MDRLLPCGPMARRLRVSVAWLKEEADAGRVPCVKAGRAYLFSPREVEAELLRRAKLRPAAPGEKKGER